MIWRLVAFVLVPLAAMVTAAGYATLLSYRLRDWRPVLFIGLLALMSIHQVNEVLVVLDSGTVAALTGFGEYPETAANLTAAFGVVLLLRFVAGEQELAGRLAARVEREQALRERNERLDEFASIVSHDIKSPLEVATTRLELARDDGADSDHLDSVEASLDRIETILDDTLTLARQGQTVTDPEPVGVASVATDGWATVASGDADLQVRDDPTVAGDRDRLRQLFENLLGNAVEHGSTGGDEGGDENGTVTVAVGATTDGFYVADDGPGVPADAREEVLEPGYTTGADGNGLGLAIVERIAAAHGWEVDVAESDAGGARFVVSGVDRLD